MLLDEYLSPTHWTLQTSNQSDDEFTVEKPPDWMRISSNEKASSLAELGHNILLITLLLEGIGNFAMVIFGRNEPAQESTHCFSCSLLIIRSPTLLMASPIVRGKPKLF